ncbi:MAG: family 43 glycosylhydrolase, partial [Oscillospiraceae bacterium]|jgi:GH43 family beta-xylosidase|nr:family 43 glycosylhydrolase [Oscillospiraceae bacterium]
MVSTDLDSAAGWQQLDSPDFYMAPSTKHGGVISLTKAQYDAVRKADAVSLAGEADFGRVNVKLGSAAGVAAANMPQTARVNLAYERGAADLPIDWDLSTVDFSEVGVYDVTGTVRTIGANRNQWVGAGGSTAWNAADRTLYSATALTVSAEVEVTEVEMLAWYRFDGTGATVTDASGSGHDAALLGAGGTVANGVLTLPGGANGSGAAYVQLPTGMFDAQNTLTISVWLKNETGPGNYAAMFFGTTANPPRQYWLLNPSNPDGRFKSVVTNSSSSSPWSTEYGISPTNAAQGVAGPITGNDWALYTTVITANSVTGYYNGDLVGTVATTRRVDQFGANLVGYIGRSSYPDVFYHGGVADVRIYAEALSAAEVKAIYEESDFTTEIKLAEAVQDLDIGDTSAVVTDLALPASGLHGTAIAWESSDPDAVTAEGGVTLGSAAREVTLTATLTLNGKAKTKQFKVTLVADSEIADAVLAKVFISAWLTRGDVLPTFVQNVPVVWTSDAAGLIGAGGAIVPPSDGVSEATLTATVGAGGGAKSKVFSNVRILGKAVRALSYTRAPTSGNDKINASMHLALAAESGYEALNHNRGVLFPKADFTVGSAGNGTTKIIQSPYVFRKTDGGFGVAAVRRNTDGNPQSDLEGSSLILFDSADLTHFTEVGLVGLDAGGGRVQDPVVEYDASAGRYAVWYDVDDVTWRTYTEDFSAFSEAVTASKPARPAIQSGIAGAVPVNTVWLTEQEAQRARDRLATVVNTKVEGPDGPIETEAGSPLMSDEIGGAVAYYSDGSSAVKPVLWDSSGVDFDTPGTYKISGVVGQEDFAFPLISRRADPNMIQYNGSYYFISTDDNGQDEFFVRKAGTLEGIATAADNKILGVPVQDMVSCLWAPEFHIIGGGLYLYFAGSNVSGGSGWANVSARVMKLKDGGDPAVAADWDEPKKILRADGAVLYAGGITLDMTIVKDGGKAYAIWSQRAMNPTGPADLYIGEINQDEPWKLVGEPVELIKPDYSWDRNTSNVVEGAYALKNDGKIYVTFSGSNVDRTYCVGMLTAAEGTDLLNPANWTRTNYPILDAGSVPGQDGPGHNSYLTDDNGKVYNIFHATLSSGSTRDFGIRPVHFAKDGRPILDMTADREILPENRLVEATIVVEGNAEEGASLLADFNFNTAAVSGVFDGGNAKAAVSGTYALQAKEGEPAEDTALYLNGSSNNFLSVTKRDGGSLLAGYEEITISFDAKPNRTATNWVFYAAPDANAQTYQRERYLGVMVNNGTTTVERYNNSGSRPANPSAATGSDWAHIDVVITEGATQIYVKGKLVGTASSNYTLSSILGSGGIVQIGKANWTSSGEYYNGWIDNFKIYDRALTAQEIAAQFPPELAIEKTDQVLTQRVTKDGDKSILTVVLDHWSETGATDGTRTDKSQLALKYVLTEGAALADERGSPIAGGVFDYTNPRVVVMTDRTGAEKVYEVRVEVLVTPVRIPGQTDATGTMGMKFFADPEVFADNGKYYIYPTTDGHANWRGWQIHCFESDDLVNWTDKGVVVNLRDQNLDGTPDSDILPSRTTSAWAPAMAKRDGRYYLYFSGQSQTNVSVSDRPDSGFVMQPVQVANGIDPAVFQDPQTGKWYISWGQSSARYAELNDDMISVKSGTQVSVTAPNFREGSFLHARQYKGEWTYYFTYSIDDTNNTTYRVAYSTAKSMAGPWTSRGEILNMDTGLGILGTGHHSVLQTPGTDDWYAVYHCFLTDEMRPRLVDPNENAQINTGNKREIRIARITYTEPTDEEVAGGAVPLINRIPVTYDGTPPETIPAVTVSGADGPVGDVGAKLTASFSVGWNAVSWQWYRGSDVIEGATGAEYVPAPEDVGLDITVRGIAESATGVKNNSGGGLSRTYWLASSPVSIAAPQPPAPGANLYFSLNALKVGDTLTTTAYYTNETDETVHGYLIVAFYGGRGGPCLRVVTEPFTAAAGSTVRVVSAVELSNGAETQYVKAFLWDDALTPLSEAFTFVAQPAEDNNRILPDDMLSDFAALTLAEGDGAPVTEDIALPTRGARGSAITWTSSDEATVAADGALTRPAHGQGDRAVTLVATLRLGADAIKKAFRVVVKEQSAAPRANE